MGKARLAPPAPKVKPPGIPDELFSAPIFCVWRYEERNGKLAKVPYLPSGRRARVNDPSGWASYWEALEAYERGKYDGIGIRLGPVPGMGVVLVGLDLDWKGWEGEGVPPEALAILEAFPTYREWSPSGRGAHVLLFGKLPPWARNRYTLAPGVELEVYDEGRYFTLTGLVIGEEPLRALQGELEGLLRKLGGARRGALKAKGAGKPERPDRPERPQGEGCFVPQGQTPKGELSPYLRQCLRRLFYLKGGKELWRGKTDGYPSPSEADMALLDRLAVACRGDYGAMITLAQRSKLRRAKWAEVHYKDGRTYLEATAQEALRWYHGLKRKPVYERLWELAKGKVELFRTGDGTVWVRYRDGERLEEWPLRSRTFRTWLSRLYEGVYRRKPYAGAIKRVLDRFEKLANEAPVVERKPKGPELWSHLKALLPFDGPMGELYRQLLSPFGGVAPEGWPKSPKGLLDALKRLPVKLSLLGRVRGYRIWQVRPLPPKPPVRPCKAPRRPWKRGVSGRDRGNPVRASKGLSAGERRIGGEGRGPPGRGPPWAFGAFERRGAARGFVLPHKGELCLPVWGKTGGTVGGVPSREMGERKPPPGGAGKEGVQKSLESPRTFGAWSRR